MPSSKNSRYFRDIIKEEMYLKVHGFDHPPSDEELLEYLFDTNDRLDAVCEHLGIATKKDVRGRWHIRPAKIAEVV